MTKPRKRRRSANLRQCVENIQRIAKRKSDRVSKAVQLSARNQPVLTVPTPARRVEKAPADGTDPERYVGHTAAGRQKIRGSSTVPHGVY